MKKIGCVLVGLLMLLPFVVKAEDKEKVQVYLFRGEGCPHCEDALEFFDSIKEEYGYMYDITTYEVWYDEDNSALMTDVATTLEETASGVPYIVIGDQSFSGYDESTGEAIKELIKNNYDNNIYTDVVSPLASNKKSSNNDAMVAGIFTGFILVIIGLVIYARKKTA